MSWFRRKEVAPEEPEFKPGDKVIVTTFVKAYEGEFVAENEKENKYLVKIDGQIFNLYRSSVVKAPSPKDALRIVED